VQVRTRPTFSLLTRPASSRTLRCWTTADRVIGSGAANSLTDAGYIISHLFTGFAQYGNLQYVSLQFRGIGIQPQDLVIAVAAMSIMLTYDILDKRERVWHRLQARPLWVRWSLYYVLVLAILFYSDNNVANFIYFQF